ncbi:IS1182 family transposase, partial [Candidatus Woesearchaeota archaeon]|nr:IS1182 family transposase [Candidatus Woesearchaeota archaeon]
MAYIKGASREQVMLFPDSIDEYVTEDNPIRFVDAFVENLDMNELGFQKAKPAATGRPGYCPQDLLKLYIYGYKNRITSSRNLEKETIRNLEVIWLVKNLKPDFKTISDFRKENKNSFKKVFKKFTIICNALNLFSGELVAIDGTKIKAVNSLKKNYSEAILKKKLKDIDERIDRYLNDIENNDEKEKDVKNPNAKELQEKIKSLKLRKKEYEEIEKKLKKSGDSQISLTDPDSRAYPRKFGVPVGYNAQIAVDDKNHLIVTQDVTNAVTDIEQLSIMAKEAKKELGVEELKVCADAGYCSSMEITTCEKAGIEAYTPKINTSTNSKKGLYTKDMFKFDSNKNCYYCPAGKEMPYKFTRLEEQRRKKKRVVIYYISESC